MEILNDPDSGMQEFSCGPVADGHVVKSFPENPKYHRFLHFKGGFISVSVEGTEDRPVLRLQFHGVQGDIAYGPIVKA